MVAELKPGQAVSVRFAASRSTRLATGVIREIRRARGKGSGIRAVVVRLDNGRLCVAHPSSLQYVGA